MFDCQSKPEAANGFAPLSSGVLSTYPRSDVICSKAGFRMLIEYSSLIYALPYPATALDISCHMGDMTKLLTNFPNISQIIAVDASTESLAIAECFNDDSRIIYANLNVRDKSAIQKLLNNGGSEGGNHLDLLFSFDALHLSDGLSVILSAASSLLRPGGHFLGFILLDQPLAVQQFLQQAKSSYRWSQLVCEKYPNEEQQEKLRALVKTYYYDLAHPKLVAEFLSSGFVSCELRELHMDIFFSEQEYIQWISDLFSCSASVCAAPLDEWNDFVRQCFNNSPSSQCATMTKVLSTSNGADNTKKVLRETVNMLCFDAIRRNLE